MRKVKTVLVSLLIAIASSLISACTCTPASTGPVDQVLETGISIDCTSNNVRVTKYDETGYLLIECRKDDKFTIKYTLSPDNATTTRVNWDFVDGTSEDVLTCDRNTYSQTVSEPVTFVANNAGSTTILFESDATKKTTQAQVIVAKPKDQLPSYTPLKATDFSYSASTATLSWTEVNSVIENDVNKTCVEAGVTKPTGYEVYITDLTHDVDLEPRQIGQNSIQLERGIEYAVSVVAIGNSLYVNNSEKSDVFKFCQLNSATELKNDNGVLTFNVPKFSDRNVIYLEESKEDGEKITKNYGNLTSFIADEIRLNDPIYPKLDNYKISIKSYPHNYLEKGYSVASNGVRYYPSVECDPIEITRITTPTVEINNITAYETIVGGVTFSSQTTGYNLYSEIRWNSLVEGLDIQYAYAIYQNGEKKAPSDSRKYFTVSEEIFKTDEFWKEVSNNAITRNVVGPCELKVYAFGDKTNTISSDEVTFTFSMLAPLDGSASGGNRTAISNNKLSPIDAQGCIYGMELYFVDSIGSNHKFYYVSGEDHGIYHNTKTGEIDISKIGLKAGEYDVYARYVGVPSETNNNSLSATSKLTKVNQEKIIVCAAPSSLSLDNDGVLTFTDVSGASSYTINIIQKSGTSVTSSISTEITAGSTSSYEEPHFASNSGSNSINIYHVIGYELLQDVANVNLDNVDTYIGAFTSSRYSLEITVVTNKENAISSDNSAKITKQRHDTLTNINLSASVGATSDAYSISFTSVSGTVDVDHEVTIGYLDDSNNNEFVAIAETSVSAKGSETVSISLSDVKLNENYFVLGAMENVAQYIVANKCPITIKLHAEGNVTSGGSSGKLNSIENLVTYNVTVAPSSLSMDDEGNLSFISTDLTEGNRSFAISFMGLTSGINDVQNVTVTGSVVDDKVEFSANVLDKIKNKFKGEIVAISIREVDSTKVIGEFSGVYYAYMIPNKDITRVMTNSNEPAIKVEGITAGNIQFAYTITVGDKTTTIFADSENKLLPLIAEDVATISAVEYELVLNISGSADENAENSQANPIVLVDSSEENKPSSIKVTFKSGVTNPTVSGKYVVWTNVDSNATYQIAYNGTDDDVAAGTTSYEIASKFGNDSTMPIKVIVNNEGVLYTQHGVCLIGDNSETTIEKLSIPSDINSDNGNITFISQYFDPTNPPVVTLKVYFWVEDTEHEGSWIKSEKVQEYSNFNGNEYFKADCVEGGAEENKYLEWTLYDFSAEISGGDRVTFEISLSSEGYVDGDYSVEIPTATQLIRLNTPIIVGSSFGNSLVAGTENDTVNSILYWDVLQGSSKYVVEYTKTVTGEDDQKVTVNLEIIDGKYFIEKIETPESGETVITLEETELFGFDAVKEKLFFNYGAFEIDGFDEIDAISIKGSLNKIYWDIDANADTFIVKFGTQEYKLKTNGTKFEIESAVKEGESEVIKFVETSLFGKENDKYFFIYDENVVLASDAKGIECVVTIQAYTSKLNYINSLISDGHTLTKSASAVTVTPASDYSSGILISNYVPTNANALPTYISYVVERYSVEVETPSNGGEDQGVAPTADGDEGGAGADTSKVIVTVHERYRSEKITYASWASDITATEAEKGKFIDLNDIIAGHGVCRIFITFYGNGQNILDSETFIVNNITKLPTTSLKTVDGVLTWGNNDEQSTGITSYSLKITDKDGVETIINNLVNTDQATPKTSLTDDVLESAGFTFVTNSLYTVEVRSNGTDVVSSSWSESFKIMKLNAPNSIEIDSNDNNEPILTWKESNGDSIKYKYYYEYYNQDETFSLDEFDSEKNNGRKLYDTINLTDVGDSDFQYLAIETDMIVRKTPYVIKVKTIGNTTTGVSSVGLLSSDFAISGDINYIANQSNPGIIDGNLKWTKVNGAESYKITLTESSSGDETYRYSGANNYYSFLQTDTLKSGNYDIRVDAITTPAVAIISTHESTENNNETSLYCAEALTDLKVVNGELSWSVPVSSIIEFAEANETTILALKGTELNATKDNLSTKIIDYIKDRVNYGNNKEIDFLSFLYSFNMNINGVDTVVSATSAKVVAKNDKDYKEVTSSYGSSHLLMFTYVPRLSSEIIEEIDGGNVATSETDPGEYVIKVSGRGNTVRYADITESVEGEETPTTLSLAVASSRYTSTMTVYKPNTPSTWVADEFSDTPTVANDQTPATIEDESEEGSEGGEENEGSQNPPPVPRGIVRGNVLWNLVSKDIVTESVENPDDPENPLEVQKLSYHNDYVITATSAEAGVSGDAHVVKVTAPSEQVVAGTGDKYYKHVKDIFADGDSYEISTNTHYYVSIHVAGTVDSSVEGFTGKIYLNSDKYQYHNKVNILENNRIEVKNSSYSWAPSNGSLQTNVYIYGPFEQYAPVEDSDDNAEMTLWKNSISSHWTGGKFNNPSTGITANTPRLTKLEIPLGSSDFSLTKESDDLKKAEEINNYITKFLETSTDFGPGGYIIRKQEIGDNRGVVDTVFSEELMIDNLGVEPEYGLVVNKLAPVTSVDGSWIGTVGYNEEETNSVFTMTQGKFVWNKSPLANAYKLTIIENIDGNKLRHEDIIVMDEDSTRNIMVYELPDTFSANGGLYSLEITAIRINDLGNGQWEYVDNYFSSDMKTTDEYLRAGTPENLKLTEDGVLTWDVPNFTQDGNPESSGYIMRINDDKSNLIYQVPGAYSFGVTLTNIDAIKNSGLTNFNIYLLAIGSKETANVDAFINSAYTFAIDITRLGSPEAMIKDGELVWGQTLADLVAGNPTKTELTISGGRLTESLTMTLDSEVTSYPLYTLINKYGQTNDDSYMTGTYSFIVKYQGVAGDVVKGGKYYIVDSETTLSAEKLKAPDIKASDNSAGNNKIEWQHIDNAEGYKVIVIGNYKLSDEETDALYSEILYLNDNYGTGYENLLVNDNGTLTLNLTTFLTRDKELGLSGHLTDGVKVYIQAVGSREIIATDNGNKYLSSSYSNCEEYKTPKAAMEGNYNPSTGVISWKLDDADQTDRDILLQLEYMVLGVSQAELDRYWEPSMADDNDIIKALGVSRRSVTSEVVIENELYNLTITDSVLIKKYKAYTSNGQLYLATPTSYRLNNVGTNYKISITVLSAYASEEFLFSTYGENASGTINLTLFKAGDGSQYYPYEIGEAVHLNAIRYFPDKHFKLVEDIALTTTIGEGDEAQTNIVSWNIVKEDFTGVLDGNGKTISGVVMRSDNGVDDGYQLNLAMFKFNAGTIKNLNIEDISIKIHDEGDDVVNDYIRPVYAAVIAIENTGTIENVHVTKGVVNANPIKQIVKAGGLVVSNSVDEDNNIGTIYNSSYSGDLYGDQIGGIAFDNYGIIEQCYTKGNAHIEWSSYIDNGQEIIENKNIVYGGIVGKIYGGASITNCYTQLIVVANVGVDGQDIIGGLVGTYDNDTISSDGATITGCYVVVNFAFNGNSGDPTYYVSGFMIGDATTLEHITFQNNAYLIEKATYSTDEISFEINEGGFTDDKVDKTSQLSDLKEAMNYTGSIYDVTGEGYPTFKVEN